MAEKVLFIRSLILYNKFCFLLYLQTFYRNSTEIAHLITKIRLKHHICLKNLMTFMHHKKPLLIFLQFTFFSNIQENHYILENFKLLPLKLFFNTKFYC